VLNLLWGLVSLLVVLWLLGFILHVAGNLIHIILLLAIALAVYNFAIGRDKRQR
jgi:Family of unknown function (DUF5670)